ncbi:MAG: cyclic nucleotide-binding domain-containing protein [Candidatus Abyssobacteria bacterium SURF_5]|uniref:Cyclic nucleotide-binding domain-containing protein n=1 Tax=Abyssobacteria bacterium (strain SURF_5) TaxID=2093360 RepID=A0A3A4NBW5_ABYX5|nr:MAG: cyclic nucleotide-binding domain-containing protein [Candidatus Abyssubacteria bacterium SURF_5]
MGVKKMKQEKKERSGLSSCRAETGLWPQDLRGCSFFSHFSEKETSHLLKIGTVHQCARGEFLVREKEHSRDLFIVLSGEMVVTKTLYAGDERKLGTIEPGEFFGEMAFLDGLPRSASVSCWKEGAVFKISREAFDRLSAKKPAIAYKVTNIIAAALTERLRRSNDVVEDFFSNPNKAILEFKTRLLKIQTMLQRL